jgi:hypothetical protein
MGGTYSVIATDATTGCASAATVIVSQSTALPVSVGSTSPTCQGGSNIMLTASGATTYVWSANTVNAVANTAEVAGTTAGTYTVTVTGTTGACMNSTTIAVTVNPTPSTTAASTNVTAAGTLPGCMAVPTNTGSGVNATVNNYCSNALLSPVAGKGGKVDMEVLTACNGGLTFTTPVIYAVQCNAAGGTLNVNVTIAGPHAGTMNLAQAALYGPVNAACPTIPTAGASFVDCNSSTTPTVGSSLSLSATGVPPNSVYLVILDANAGGTTFNITSTPSTALPVKLLTFNGKINGEVNDLWWATASEVNSAFHILESSTDGVSDWKYVGTRNGAGTSNVRHDYKMTDNKPFKRAFYRLRLVDHDGSFEYSNVVLLERTKTNFGFVNVYPVPTNGEVKVDYQVEEAQPLTFKVIDVLGRVLDVKYTTAAQGVNSTTFDLSNYANAVYMITMENGTRKTVFKVVKTN